MKIDAIKLNKANPRQIKDASFKKLCKSVKEFPKMLALRPIVVDRDGTILGGNMRYRALLSLGYKEIPDEWVRYADTLTDEEKRRFIIEDNVEFGEWDIEALANEWDTGDLSDWGVDVPDLERSALQEAVEDDFNEEEVTESVCRKGDVWQLGNHRLMCGDSTSKENFAKLMQGELAHLWLTDPPYNVAVKNSQGMTIANDNMASDEFRIFLRNAFAAVYPVLDKGCPFYVWFSSKEHINFEGALNDVGLQVRQELIWNKNHFILGRAHYQWKHEPCLYGWKGDSCRYFIDVRNRASVIEDNEEINIDKMKAAEMRALLHKIYEERIPTTVVNCMKPNKDEDHPTMKPVRLFGFQMANSSRPGDIVLDAFGGSGTTMIAAEQLGRKCRMMELDPHYCDVIIARWEKLTEKKAVKISNHKED